MRDEYILFDPNKLSSFFMLWTPGSAGMLATTRIRSIAGKLITADHQQQQVRKEPQKCYQYASNSRETSNSSPSGTKRTPATARIPAAVWMQAITVMQATTVVPSTSNNKDDSNIMTAYNSRNASHSRNKSNRAANTVWMPEEVGMLLKSDMTAAAGTTASSWMSSAVGPPE